MVDVHGSGSENKGWSILGCGWLALPLAKKLRSKGYDVKGSRRDEKKFKELEEADIEAWTVRAELSSPLLPVPFFRSKGLLIDIPPGRKDPEGAKAYPEKVQQVLERALEQGVERILFVSSTSVHAETNDRIPSGAEGSSEKGNGPLLRKAEELVWQTFPEGATIVRFAGLLGPGRHPVRYLSGRKSSRSGKALVNMIHRQDAVRALELIIENQLWGYRFDIAAPEHPTRERLYSRAARSLNIDPPEFDPEAELSYKMIDPSYFEEISGFSFDYPDPLEMPVE